MVRRLVAAFAGACALLAGGVAHASPPAPTPSASGAPLPLASPTATPAPAPLSPELLQAQAAAQALQARVDSLQADTEAAVEHYNSVTEALSAAKARHDTAVLELGIARATQKSADTVADARVRSLYIQGAPPGLAALTIGGQGTDLLDSYDSTRWVVQQDRLRLAAASAAAEQARTAEASLAAALVEQQRLERAAAAARATVSAKLAEQTRLLATASAQVQALFAKQKAEERRQAEALAAMVADARLLAGSDGVSMADNLTLSPFVRGILAGAEDKIGLPYQWGATGPGTFDCSGLTSYVFARVGVQLPRTSRQQWYAGTHVTADAIAPGDLLFWASNTGDPGTIHHVSIYIGGGYMIAAPHTGALVQVQRVYSNGYIGAVRVPTPEWALTR